MQPLDRLYKPKSIAVIGASNNKAKAGYEIMYGLRTFPGKVYPLNPQADIIFGQQAFPNLKAVGQPVDLAILTIPAKSCVKALQEAGEAGVGAALVVSGGFAETGEDEGIKLQNKITSICRKYKIQLLGPNTVGFTNPIAKVTANFVPWLGEINPGKVGIVSQSGAMSYCLATLVQTLGLGASLITGIGNGPVTKLADVVAYLADDENTKVIVLYFEGLGKGEGRHLYNVIREVTKKKPVIFLTIGRSNIAKFAASHTGTLLGSYKLKTTALTQAGAVKADSGDDAIDAAGLLAQVRLQPKENPGVGVLTGQAGPALVIADYLRSKNVLIPELQPSTVEKISKELLPISFMKNPVDTTRPGKRSAFANVLQTMAEDEALDLLAVFALYKTTAMDPVDIFEQCKDIKQPLIFGTGGFPEHINPTLKKLAGRKIPAFTSPDRTAKAIRALVDDSKAAYRKQQAKEGQRTFKFNIEPLEKTPDEAAALAILERLGIPSPRHAACSTHGEALQAFAKLKKPCVVKVLHPSITHKTESGGVILGVETKAQLIEALQRVDRIETETPKRYLLAETAAAGLELIVGAVNDISFGPAVLLGLGGTTAEAWGDVSMRLAPLTEGDAHEMIDELRGKKLLSGWRGAPAVDKKQLIVTLIKIGQLVVEHPEIKEMDINPLRIYEKGLLALDALIVLQE
ncbi:MAG: CoA-binding protein [Firmicutes bacterium]|nr:CoA-binding protein [Bacillota bacterium]